MALTSKMINRVQLGTNVNSIYDIAASYDSNGDSIIATYGAGLDISGNNTLSLLNKNDVTLNEHTVTIQDASTSLPGLMSVQDKIKLDGFSSPIAYATISYVDSLIEANNAMVYKGVVNQNSDLPSNPTNGWTYKVGTAGTYSGISDCNVGDLLMYNSSQSTWERIPVSVDGALYKTAPFSDAGFLVAEGTAGAVKTVTPVIQVSGPSNENGQTLSLVVPGENQTINSTLGKASTSAYGVTMLSNTPSQTAENVAATPKAVYEALAGVIANPITVIYTLLPENSSTATNATTFKWNGNSVTITDENITADSYEMISIPPANFTSANEISALNSAILVDGGQGIIQDGPGYLTLTALGNVPTIPVRIRVTHNYTTDDKQTAVTTAAAQAILAEAAASRAENYAVGMKKKTVTVATTDVVSDLSNSEYPYKTTISWNGIVADDWVDGTGLTSQDWMLESVNNNIILHFSAPLTENVTFKLYWAACPDSNEIQQGE